MRLCVLVAPSFNGRTAASGAAYRGSNPWGATKSNRQLARHVLQRPPALGAREWRSVAEFAPHPDDPPCTPHQLLDTAHLQCNNESRPCHKSKDRSEEHTSE